MRPKNTRQLVYVFVHLSDSAHFIRRYVSLFIYAMSLFIYSDLAVVLSCYVSPAHAGRVLIKRQ